MKKFAFVLSIAMVFVFSTANAYEHYSITDLGPVIALGINNLGQVVGDATVLTQTSYSGFFWDSSTGRQDFGGWCTEPVLTIWDR